MPVGLAHANLRGGAAAGQGVETRALWCGGVLTGDPGAPVGSPGVGGARAPGGAVVAPLRVGGLQALLAEAFQVSLLLGPGQTRVVDLPVGGRGEAGERYCCCTYGSPSVHYYSSGGQILTRRGSVSDPGRGQILTRGADSDPARF